ncbi:DUF7344 domain-containing protein [Natrinema amylolyticum]|uniref:DUF7344 domain-containing protein n=1 Tax=Natrinema amylolyticum TaxID=2878679 RepID=UPI001CFA3F3E|nr:ArsR family transcriptional regulator [Natrinema amylolyticum]
MGQDNHDSNGSNLSLDACLELLANRQRRAIIEFFLDSETDHVPIDELISTILDEEVSATGERPGHDSVAATLYHVHLPKFTDAGILEYDTRNLDVRYHGDDRVEKLYEAIQEFE